MFGSRRLLFTKLEVHLDLALLAVQIIQVIRLALMSLASLSQR